MFKQHSSMTNGIKSALASPSILTALLSTPLQQKTVYSGKNTDSCNVSDKHKALRHRTAKPSIYLEPAVDLILKALISFQSCCERTC